LNNINSREHQVCFSKDKEQLDKCRLILENIPKQQFSIYTSSPDYPLYLTWNTFDWNNKGRSDKEYYIEKTWNKRTFCGALSITKISLTKHIISISSLFFFSKRLITKQ
jgi:hypothetical protein